jgi:hypothetical protein
MSCPVTLWKISGKLGFGSNFFIKYYVIRGYRGSNHDVFYFLRGLGLQVALVEALVVYFQDALVTPVGLHQFGD